MSDGPTNPLATPLPWDLASEGYVSEIVPVFTRYSEDALRLARLPAGARVLDVACGPGTLTFLAARTASRVTAVDFAPRMVEALRAQAGREGVDNVEVQVGDGQALPFADRAFDAAFSMFGLIFFPDRAKGFRELHRVLVTGGRAAVSSWLPMDRVPVMAAVFETVQALLPALPRGGGKWALSEADEFREEMTAAGFRDVEVTQVTHGWEAPSMDALWASFEKSSAPLVLLRSSLGQAEWARVREGVRVELTRRFGAGPQRVEMPAWIGVGTA